MAQKILRLSAKNMTLEITDIWRQAVREKNLEYGVRDESVVRVFSLFYNLTFRNFLVTNMAALNNAIRN